jgi:histidinol-phosphate phosphatase family protein
MTINYPLEPLYDRDISALKQFSKGVVVFDRDGTLVEDAGQHNDPKQLKLRSGAVEGVFLLKAMGFGVAIASNQAGLETEKFTLANLTDFNETLKRKFMVGNSEGIDLILTCPHQNSTNCNCRKPKNGLLEAIRESGLGEPILFLGDAETDRLAAISSSIEFLNVANSEILEQIENWIRINEFS